MEANNALLLLRQEDDPAALEFLIKIYTPYVFSVLRRKLGSFAQSEDIEELASNVFFSLWQHRKRLKQTRMLLRLQSRRKRQKTRRKPRR